MYKGTLLLQHGGRIEQFSFQMASPEELMSRIPTLIKYVPKWVINLDGEPHRRIRVLLVKALTSKVVEKVRGFAKNRVEKLLDYALERGEIEFNEEIARSLTGYVLFKLVGMPESQFPQLREWATAIVEALTGLPTLEMLDRAEISAAQMNEAVLIELENVSMSLKMIC